MQSIEELKENIKKLNDIYNIEYGIQLKLKKEIKTMNTELSENEKKISDFERKNFLIKEVSEEARNQAKDYFARLATHGLKIVLGEHLSVDIEVSTKGDSPTLDFLVTSEYDDYIISADPTEGEGGGVADIVALASFLNLNHLKLDTNKAPLMLDEPTKYVSKGNSREVSDFISQISKNKQIIMSTHDQVSQDIADKAYLLKKEDGITKVIEVTKEG